MLNTNDHPGGLQDVIARATAVGVEHMLCVSVDLATFPDVLRCAKIFPNVSASVGQHPNDAAAESLANAQQLATLADDPLVVALGETGLDYYRTSVDGVPEQQQAFRQHIQAAKLVNKPVIIHTRDAREDTLMIMQEEGIAQVGAVLHCFTESWEMAEAAMQMNCLISFSGIVTFKNAQALQAVAKQVPLNRLLIETDAPYLTPVPHRGKPNEPAYVKYVAEFIAKLRGESYETIAQITTENFYQLFNPMRRDNNE